MLRIRKLDIFIIKSFVLLFIGTFFICLFVFMMQFLWRYVDELIGKGLELSVMAKFFYYSGLSLVATSLPLAVLLASLITFGNFGERLELLAMKAAGISLMQIMRPLMIFVGLICCASFYFQNVITPKAQVKLYTLLISMRQKSPELDIPEGVFYDQIEGYNVYVKKKNRVNGMLYNVMIYNFSDGFDNAHIVVADSGKLEMTADKQHLRLNLYSGEQFENLKMQGNGLENVPYRRETFCEKHMIIVFDSGFNMASSEFFQRDARSKNMHDLAFGADSIKAKMDSIGRQYYRDARNYILRAATSHEDTLKVRKEHLQAINIDSLFNISSKVDKKKILSDAQSSIQTQASDLMFKSAVTADGDEDIRRHQIEWLNKITVSLACLVFFFIGAPLGAIIRKGGLGFPVIISVLIFIIYYIIDNTGYKLARNGELPIWFGRWVSTMVLAPTGAFITYKANNDSVVFNVEVYVNIIRKVLGLRTSRHLTGKEVIIQDPNYRQAMIDLASLAEYCQSYSDKHRFAKAPNYYKIFTLNKSDDVMADINKQMEDIIEELANSKDAKVIGLLNQFPYLMVNAHKSPFNKFWLNLLFGILVPIGLFYYFRVWRFGLRLHRDLKNIIQISHTLQDIIVKDGLVEERQDNNSYYGEN